MNKIDLVRILDIIFSLAVIVITLPLWLVVALLLLFTGEGDVFYRQSRVGRNGQLFNLFKFATMVRNSPSIGSGELTLHNDPRVLPVGRVLRKTKLNELPQLINVLLGEMSLIGPRPLTPKYFSAYPINVQNVITSIRPGLSGVGSIIFRDEEEIFAAVSDPESFDINVILPYKGRIETWYTQNRNVKIYLFLIILTIWAVLRPDSRAYRGCLKGLPALPSELEPYF